MFHIVGFQVLKYYFYVSVSFAGSVFSLAKLGRLFVSDYLTVCVRFVFYVVVRVVFFSVFLGGEY